MKKLWKVFSCLQLPVRMSSVASVQGVEGVLSPNNTGIR